jgi:hypothetical protein
MTKKRILSLDSQILNSIQLCARHTRYRFVDCLEQPEKPEALERGSLMHDILEAYYALTGKCFNPESELGKFVVEKFGAIRLHDEMNKATKDTAAVFASEIGRARSVACNLDIQECDEVIYQFSEYHKYYRHDGWLPLAVEEVGSKLLFEDDDIKIIYNFKIDLIAEQGNKIIPWDHKTSSRRQDPSSLSNQFMGYAFGVNSLNVLVNKIGFQKTLAPGERFQRDILTYSKQRLEEWVNNTIYWARMLDFSLNAKHYPMNLTSCDKFRGCMYQNLCKRDEALRELIAERDYKTGTDWDVAKILEGVSE